MGIADRDYARSTPQPRRRGGHWWNGGVGAGAGRFRLVSVNTWLIVINVAVFMVGHMVFPMIQDAARRRGDTAIAEAFTRSVSAGRVVLDGVTQEQQDRGVVDRAISRPMPKMPGYFYNPIYDPKTVLTDKQGRAVLDARGQPIFQEIGGERFTFKPVLDAWGHFSTGKAFEAQVWRFVTFQFLHANVTHLLFNMLGLWFVGGMVEEFLGRRRYLAFYLVCGIFGAISYLILNFIGWLVTGHVAPAVMEHIPALLFDDIYTPLVGASAGVFGVLMAAAFIAPDAIVDVMLIIPMKMRTAVYIFFGLAALNLLRGGNNAGGDAAHVGGAFAGYYFIRHTHLLRDFFEFVGVPRGRSRAEERAATAEVDRILDKVHAKGIASLSDAEKKTLHRSTTGARGGSAAGYPS